MFPPHIQDRLDRGMGCGSGIGMGWMPIVLWADKQLAEIDPHYRIDQIKEKFGGLRYYFSSDLIVEDQDSGHRMYSIVAAAEQASMKTCEVCGEPGVTRKGGWIKTLCDEHA